jgi:Tol biopolymer transport system component
LVRRLASWPLHEIVALFAICILLLSACGGSDSGNPGTELGNGQLLAYIGSDGNLWLSRLDGSGAHAVTTQNCNSATTCYGPPSWSSDGQTVAVFGPKANGNGNLIYLYNRKGILVKTIIPANPLAFSPILWSPDNTQLAYEGRPSVQGNETPPLGLILFSISSGNQVGIVTIPAQGDDATCPDDTTSGPLGSLVDRAINGSFGLPMVMDWQHNGNKFLVGSGRCFLSAGMAQSGGTSVQPLGGENTVQGAFSPDGKQIAAVNVYTSSADLVLFTAPGTTPQKLLTDNSPSVSFVQRLSMPVWSHDGHMIYFMRGTDLWSIGADGSNPHKLANGTSAGDTLKAVVDPTVGPDGQHLAWVELTYSASANVLHSSIVVANTDGQQAKSIARDAIWPAWS